MRLDRRWQFQRLDLISLAILIASLIALFNSSLTNSWGNRDNWRAFGSTHTPWQLWTIWPWTAIAILPLGIGAIAGWRTSSREIVAALLPMFVALTATAIFFGARTSISFHFGIAGTSSLHLPMLAWTAGAMPIGSFRSMDMAKRKCCCFDRGRDRRRIDARTRNGSFATCWQYAFSSTRRRLAWCDRVCPRAAHPAC